MRASFLVSLLVLVAIGCIGCTEDPLYPSRGVTVTASNLPVLESGTYYQLWLSYPYDYPAVVKSSQIARDELRYFSVGNFVVDAAGGLHGIDGGAAAFTIPAGYNAGLFSSAILTVEPSTKSDTIPGARLLGGIFVRNGSQESAQLLLTGSDAFGGSLDTALLGEGSTGSFLLDTPTSPPPDDFFQGIWFAQSNGMNQSLPLPLLTVNKPDSNWRYEAWLVHRLPSGDSEYISLGRFTRPDRVDSDGPGPGAGSAPGLAYAMPGEDFVAAGHERRLNDGTYGVVVSLSPATIPTTRPLLTLLRRDTIPTEALRVQSLELSPLPSSGRPVMEIAFVP